MPRHFQNWLKGYLEYSRASEAPTLFHFWTGVSTIAGALRRRVKVNELTYELTPNFYIILVAPAGVATKSTTLNLGMSLLERIEGIRFGPNSGSWQGIADVLEKSTIYFRRNKDDETEKPTPMSAITCAASELGTFLRPDDSQAVSFLTDVWDGKLHTYRHHTRHSGTIEIVNPWLNLIGATTPAWIRTNVPEGMIGEGLISRIVFVYGEQKRQLVARPSKLVRSRDFYALQEKLVEDLTEISTLAGEVQYSEAADHWMDQWYDTHNKNPRATHMASDRFGGYIARKQSHLIKLAIVLSAAKRNTLILEEEDFKESEVLLVEAEVAMIKVFESIGLVEEAKQVAEIVTIVRAYGWLDARELYYNFCHNIMAEKDFRQALRLAIDGNLLNIVEKEGRKGVSPASRTLN